MEIKKGTFYGVSVGPGDPELITVKALRAIDRCAVIAAPRTASGEMLALDIARRAADLTGKTILPLTFAMTRDPARRTAAHEAAAQAVRSCLDAGQDVAMLNLGDVSIYATCAYLAQLLRAQGYEVCMIPGVPSFCAVAARLGVSLTEMDGPVHIVPGGAQGLGEALDLPGTKILMKSGAQLQSVLSELRRRGTAHKSAMVSNCGLADEVVCPDLSAAVPKQETGYFSTVIVKE